MRLLAEDKYYHHVSDVPLRRSELSSMDGETVWVEILHPKAQKIVGTQHDFGIVRTDKHTDELFVEMLKYNYSLYQIGYGDIWIAYRIGRRNQ